MLVDPIAGEAYAALLGTLILLWSVPVKGHIIASAIETQWYIGTLIAGATYRVDQAGNRAYQ